MSAAPLLARSGAAWVALLVGSACGGQRVVLGDGPLEASSSLEAGAPDSHDDAAGGTAGSPPHPAGAGGDTLDPAFAGSGGAGGQGGAAGGRGPTGGARGDGAPMGGRDGAAAGPGDAGMVGEGDGATDAGTGTPIDAGPVCERGATAADQVLWLGDSWFTDPGTQHTRVVDLARMAGALDADETYPNVATAAKSLAEIISEQYRPRQAQEPPLRVLVMTGGTWDTLTAQGSEASVEQVLATFAAFLDELALAGTVDHLIYMLQPELPFIPGVAALRPGLMDSCEQSTVPCHFLDLQPLWVGHDDYTAGNGIQASQAGATVIADAIWDIMVDNCIAQ